MVCFDAQFERNILLIRVAVNGLFWCTVRTTHSTYQGGCKWFVLMHSSNHTFYLSGWLLMVCFVAHFERNILLIRVAVNGLFWCTVRTKHSTYRVGYKWFVLMHSSNETFYLSGWLLMVCFVAQFERHILLIRLAVNGLLWCTVRNTFYLSGWL